ncbi:hypothetical protein C1646_758303 [Rhizophagus diaphanus]|nr:hypothetical protein C1646_758303 [Rhizophagus diaphanus] [Rhizophagus sp. MUCL 43196]
MELAYNFTEYRYRFLKEYQESAKVGFSSLKPSSKSGFHKEEITRLAESFLEKLQKTIVQEKEAGQLNKVLSHDMEKKDKEAEKKEQIILEKDEKIRKFSQEVETTRPFEILLYAISACWNDDKIITVFKNLGLVKKQIKRFVKEDLKNLTDNEIMDYYERYGWFFGKVIYIKQKRYFYAYFCRQSSNKEWKSDLNVRRRDHGRENEVLIISKKEREVTSTKIPKDRLEKEKDKIGNKKAAGSSKSYEEEEVEVLEIIDRYRKKLGLNGGKTESSSKGGHVTPEEMVKVVENFRKEDKKKEKIVTKEDLDLYYKVNQACSSCLPEVKKERISDDEKIGQKRVNKEELSRGM